MKRIIAYISVIIALAACSKEAGRGEEPVADAACSAVSFGYHVRSLSEAAVKSAFISPSFNDEKITGITVAVYDNATGILHYKKHFSSGFDNMEIPLHGGSVYNLYALANMGDQTGNLPSACSVLLSDFTYCVPSYSDVNSRGIPMTGRIECYTAGGGAEAVFELRRLFAKVTLNVTTAYDGGTPGGVKVTNLKVGNGNAVLSAFGSSRLVSASDRLAAEDYAANNSVDASSVVFYVPENLQGKIGSATSSRDKNPDRNSSINAVRDLLTYVDVTVSANSVYYSGTVHYRSYIGADAKTDFNVAGNSSYVWNMTLTEDGLVYDDWKTDRTDLVTISHTLTFDDDVYAANPRGSVISTVEYNDSYRGRLFGLGGFSNQGERWSVIPPAALPHSGSGTSYLDYSYDAATDKITWTPTRYAPPGDYAITVETNDGRYYDEAVIRVNDTRWINTDNAYGGRTRLTTVNRSAVSPSTSWDIGYAFGDLSVADDAGMTADSPNAGVFAGNSITGSWGQYIGYSLRGSAADVLSLSAAPTDHSASYSLSQDITMGDYVFDIFWKDSWSDAIGNYALRDSAVLRITGVYINGLRVNPTTQTIAVGQTGTLRAIVNNSGQASFKKVRWEITSGDQVISVTPTDDLNATVTGLKAGAATVRAVALDGSGFTATATVNVNNPPASLTLVPAEETIYMGTTLQYTAIATYYDGTTRDVTSSCWFNNYSASIVRIDANGLAEAQNTAGTSSITANYSELSQTVSSTATLNVVARPTPVSMDYLGDTDMYILYNGTYGAGYTRYDLSSVPIRLNYADGSHIQGTVRSLGASLASGNTDILSVSGRNIIARANGVTTMTVTCDGLQATVNVYVSTIATNRVMVYVDVNNGIRADCFLTPYNQTQQQACEVEWSSDNTSIARVNNSYGSSTTIFGMRAGTATISFKYDGQYGSNTFTITAQVQGSNSGSTRYLEIIPETLTINAGETYQLVAKDHTVQGGVDDGGVVVSAAWSVKEGGSYVSVNSSGLVTALADGTARIKASYSSRTAYATVNVHEVHHVTTRYLEVRPSQATVTVGSTKQLSAFLHTVTDGNDDGGIAVSAIWSISSGAASASVSSGGLVTALAVGNTVVLGTYTHDGETYPATAVITVVRQFQEVRRLEILPAETTISEGATMTYEVRKYTDIYADGVETYHDAEGVAVPNTDVNWSVTSGGAYASVNASGVATGLASGDATVKATLRSDTSLTATALLHVDVVFNVDPGDEEPGSGNGNY
ncbi:MAG: Ig-like domain-containing protein [Bacteroidales bacterium]|nr:Ig-like domain-containing protein [Bacteroidales bacterium]